MNFDDALSTHVAWKSKLSAYLRNPDQSLNPSEIARDNRCELGKWLESQQSSYGSNAVFQELKRGHSEFHLAAANVVRRADSGESVAQEVAIGGTSHYSKCSNRVVAAIRSMRHLVKPSEAKPSNEFGHPSLGLQR